MIVVIERVPGQKMPAVRFVLDHDELQPSIPEVRALVFQGLNALPGSTMDMTVKRLRPPKAKDS